MVQEGVVLEIERDGWAKVVPDPAGGCPHCGAAMGCGEAGTTTSGQSIRALNGVRAQPGDRVQIRYGSQSLWLAALVYGVPVLGMMLGAMAGSGLGPRLGLSSNAGSILFGIGLLLVCFGFGLFVSNRWLATGDGIPVICRVLQGAGGNPKEKESYGQNRGALSVQSLGAATTEAMPDQLRRKPPSDCKGRQ